MVGENGEDDDEMENGAVSMSYYGLAAVFIFAFMLGVAVDYMSRPSLQSQLDDMNLSTVQKGYIAYPPDVAVFDNSTYTLVHTFATYKSIAICQPDANQSLLCTEYALMGGEYYRIIAENETVLSFYLAPFDDNSTAV